MQTAPILLIISILSSILNQLTILIILRAKLSWSQLLPCKCIDQAISHPLQSIIRSIQAKEAVHAVHTVHTVHLTGLSCLPIAIYALSIGLILPTLIVAIQIISSAFILQPKKNVDFSLLLLSFQLLLSSEVIHPYSQGLPEHAL